MTDKIPEDIDQIASDIVRADYSKDGQEPDWLIYKAIALAIQSERQRCARVAGNCHKNVYPSDAPTEYENGFLAARNAIVSDILKTTPDEGPTR